MNDSKGQKILIVEDEGPILKGITLKFLLEGFVVISADDGETGLEKALNEHPDMILLDYRMPNMDGFDVLLRLRNDAWGKTAKVIMWSNSHSNEIKDRASSLGVLDFLVKSEWEYKDIVRKVREKLAAG